MIGQIVSHYKIIEKLGQGGMGVVYKAEDTRLGRLVALKFLPPELLGDAEARKRFQREAQTASSFQHQNICAIHDIDETSDGRLFISMDYYEGQTLKECIAAQGASPMPVVEVIAIVKQIAAGLRKAHTAGIFHRDMKPANIFITNEGIVKILDFGLAKLRQGSKLTRLGESVGTIAYMSPEQASGAAVDERTDIWSLGVILYEMLTGRLPFFGDYDQAFIYQILNQEPPPVQTLRKDIPPMLVKLVNGCLAKDQAQRLQSAAAMIAMLEATVAQPRKRTGVAAQPPLRSRPAWKNIKMALAGTALAVILAFSLVFLLRKPSAPAANHKTIAVLPFADLSGNPGNEYFCNGITEDILTQLSKIADLNVISRTTMMQYQGSKKSLKQIGHELQAGVILEGSVRRAQDRVRIVAQLIDAEQDKHLWAETYDREMADVFRIQSDVAGQIAGALQARLSPGEKARLTSAPLANSEAYNLFLRGRFLVSQFSKESLEKAIDLYEQSLALDSNNPSVWAALASARIDLTNFVTAPVSAELIKKARDAAQKAIRLDENCANGYSALGLIKQIFDWDWRGADVEFRKALELEPGNAFNIRNMSMQAAKLGRLDEAITLQRRAIALDPVTPVQYYALGIILHWDGRLDEAASYFKKALQLFPQGAIIHRALGGVYLMSGRLQEALAEMEQEPNECMRLQGLALAYTALGKTTAAEAALQEICKKYETEGPSQIAAIYAFRGDAAAALEWLEKAYLARDPGVTEIRDDPFYKSLKKDPRFLGFLQKLKL
jgi:serine/threonine protein kinase/tetratricopeptide (TPR) repeat protein